MKEQKKPSKIKKILKVIAIVIVLDIVIKIVAAVTMFLIFCYVSKWKLAVDFKEYEDEFNCVKDYVLQYYRDSTDKYVDVTRKDGELTLYDPDLRYYFELPEEVSEALESINEAFDPDASLEWISFWGNKVMFRTMQSYSLVWSPDEKPTWYSNPDDEREISVKKAGDGWYHIVEQ